MNGINFINQINRTNTQYNNAVRNISTGSRLSSASFGASDYSISIRTESNIGTKIQAKNNAQTINAMISTAAGGIESTVSALSSLREQLLGMSNGTNHNSDISAISDSVHQTLQTIDENSKIQYNGMNILDGSRSIAMQSDNGYQNIEMPDISLHGLGLVGEDGESTLNLTSQSGINNALDVVDNSLDVALGHAATIGAMHNSLDLSISNQDAVIENEMYANSINGDADIAEEITKLKSAETQNQLAMYAATMYNHNRYDVLKLLGQ